MSKLNHFSVCLFLSALAFLTACAPVTPPEEKGVTTTSTGSATISATMTLPNTNMITTSSSITPPIQSPTTAISIDQTDPYYEQKMLIVSFARDLLSPDHHQLEYAMARILDEKLLERFDLVKLGEKPVPKADYESASQLLNFEKAMAFEVEIDVKYDERFKKYATGEDGLQSFIITLVKIKDVPRWSIVSMGR